MKSVSVRNLTIGEDIPKICVPIIGKTKEEIINEAKAIKELPADLVEWRVDWFQDVFDKVAIVATLQALRDILCEMPILFTFRTKNEGGEKEISKEVYAEILLYVARSGYADLIDVEVFMSDDAKEMIADIRKTGVKVVGSNHDFVKTPTKEDIITRLRTMQEAGADIPKIAVMPQDKKDVQVLMNATKEMYDSYADRPIVTMSMGELGKVSRIQGELFGSAITFGSAKKASAPGQIEVGELKQMLELLHSSI